MTVTTATAVFAVDFDESEVLSETSPELDPAWVHALALQHYGIAGEMKALTGERDRNYLLQSAQSGARFMLKIDRKSTRLNSSHIQKSRMPSSA